MGALFASSSSPVSGLQNPSFDSTYSHSRMTEGTPSITLHSNNPFENSSTSTSLFARGLLGDHPSSSSYVSTTSRFIGLQSASNQNSISNPFSFGIYSAATGASAPSACSSSMVSSSTYIHHSSFLNRIGKVLSTVNSNCSYSNSYISRISHINDEISKLNSRIFI